MSDLFEFPPTRSNRAKWALEELGIDYSSNTIDFMKGEQRSELYRSIHPLGHVPAYRTDSYTMHESVAIVMQLLDENPDAELAPEIGTSERAEYYQWCVFSSAELDPVLFDLMKHTMHLPENERIPAIADRARDAFDERAEMLSSALKGRVYVLGAQFSGADIALGYDCNWAEYIDMLAGHPRLVKYYERLQARPAFNRVFTR